MRDVLSIAIDGTLRLHGGGWLHLKQLLNAWSHPGFQDELRIIIFSRQENVGSFLNNTGANATVVPVLPARTSVARRLVWQQTELPRLAHKRRADVLLCTGNTAPLRSEVPCVLVLQNAAPFSDDISWRSEGLRRWLSFKCLGAAMRASARSADRVIFISECFKNLFLTSNWCDAEKAEMIYLGGEADDMQPVDGRLLDDMRPLQPFALCVSHLYPYKQLGKLIQGYAAERDTLTGVGLKLVIVGKPVQRKEYKKLKSTIERLGLTDWVILAGPVPQDAVSPLMEMAQFFVFQSTCENCPTTLIQAFSSGLAVACSDASVMPEIAGDTALYFDPWNSREIGAALVRLATDTALRQEFASRSLRRADVFPTWEQVAEETLNVLRRAANRQVEHSCVA